MICKPRKFVIGDVHGCFETLKALIDRIKPSKEDLVVFTGDLIDRGPKSKQVVDYVRDNDWICVLGNHEQMCMDALSSKTSIYNNTSYHDLWLKNGGDTTLKSFEKSIYDYFSWFLTLPLYYLDDDILVVHGDIHFPSMEWTLQKTLEHNIENQELLWNRGQISLPQVITEGGKYNRKLVVGHTIQGFDIIMDSIYNPLRKVTVDNGCVIKILHGNQYNGLYGNLFAYEATNNELFSQPCIDIGE